jgi:type VI secretion system protein ImpC
LQIPSIPFTIVVFAPFTSPDQTVRDEDPLTIEPATFDQVVETLLPSFYVSVPQENCPEGYLDIKCKRLKDFHPDSLLQNNTFLRNLLDAKGFIEEAERKGMALDEIISGLRQWPDLPPLKIPRKTQTAQSTSASTVDNILKMVAIPEDSAATAGGTSSLTDQIDSIVQQNLRHVFSHDQFRNTEAAWRGLRFLMGQVSEKTPVHIQIVPVSPENMEGTLDAISAKLIADLPSLIVVDIPFDNTPRSLDLMEKIATLAETLLVPCITWITPKFFHLDIWQELNKLPYLPNYMDETSFAKWRSFRDKPSARWISLACNRFLTRYPYGSENPARMTRFEEEGPLWISPVWAAGALMVQSIARCGWPTRFSAWNEVRLEDLVMHSEVATGKSLTTEMFITEERVDQLIRCGIMPLTGSYNTDTACMPRETTAGDAALSYQLFVSRISRFILWCRDHFSEDITEVELEDTLKKAFSLFWQRSSQTEPEELEITTTVTGPDDRVIVSLSIKPSRRVLPSADRVDMQFYW